MALLRSVGLTSSSTHVVFQVFTHVVSGRRRHHSRSLRTSAILHRNTGAPRSIQSGDLSMIQRLTSGSLAGSVLLAASLAIVTAHAGTTATAAADGAMPPGFSLTRTGSVHDFDFAAGAWTSRQQRLKARNVGSTAWEESPGNIHCASSFMDGVTTVDAAYSPAKTPAGLWLHMFDVAKHQWTVYWVNPKTGRMDSGVVGGFDGVRGEFFGTDERSEE